MKASQVASHVQEALGSLVGSPRVQPAAVDNMQWLPRTASASSNATAKDLHVITIRKLKAHQMVCNNKPKVVALLKEAGKITSLGRFALVGYGVFIRPSTIIRP
eukprot:3680701-Amphidinium_carterae.1